MCAVHIPIRKMSKKIVLLKSESESVESYKNQLRENDFDPIFIPTLEFKFKNLDTLNEKLSNPNDYSGIIFTSPRSVEACEQAMKRKKLSDEWFEMHNYCVGEVTHNLIHSTFGMNTRGKHTGSANSLTEFIFENLEGARLTKPFLFPCGNLKQDTLQLKLIDYGYFIEPIESYETVAHSELEENLRSALENDSGGSYLAFFSPSGVNSVNVVAQKLNINLLKHKLIAIGPSTRKCMENSDLRVYKTAEKPSVEYLVKALLDS